MSSIATTFDASALHKFGNIPIGINTISLGYAHAHSIKAKLKACFDAGFHGIEVFYDDLKIAARVPENDRVSETCPRNMAKVVRELCDEYGLTVISLQPLRNVEGLISRDQHRQKLEELKEWFSLCSILRTDLIVVPSNTLADVDRTTGDRTAIVRDLREISDMGARQSPPIRFAYEAMSWGTHVSRWQEAWSLVQEANRWNLGVCLDTFQMLAKVWANPEARNGKRPCATEALATDIAELKASMQVAKLFVVQVADAKRFDPLPLTHHPGRKTSQHPLMTWSRSSRLFPLEEDQGAYLPVMEVLKACVLDLEYKGWISMEVFNKSLSVPSASVPNTHATRAMLAWAKCVRDLKMGAVGASAEGRFV